ncbi:1-phosphofructokinase family hexose kinase [Corynebacterium breve]|uniref:1-phosphofructokinase family hexose kinase n=1 Tax=Corynebacterium breve TaxID=3049799 RepID=A0ABY8VCD9_9CORY|nr:1-phosphofructokinase family hexose kinase [Corynebacterium breve]WIM66782.1 1-phosphofructokinase family hexose kinase [Corynebacterium breve]
MILTFTPNPAIDATLVIDEPLSRGEVHRPSQALRNPGGKGVNVSHALVKAGVETTALVPAAPTDTFVNLANASNIPLMPVAVQGNVRTNTAITEPDGTTTKVNELGAPLIPADVQRLADQLLTASADARAVVLAGSLPPGAPVDWYPQLVKMLRSQNPALLIAVDTSDDPLVQLGQQLRTSAPNVLKPNAFEVAQLTGDDGYALEASAEAGDFIPVFEAGKQLLAAGIDELLITLGGAGACLVTREGAWSATPPPTEVHSTVGAGDSSLAGYLIGRVSGLEFPECLRLAVAYGSAAAGLPGTEIPTREQANISQTIVSQL